MVFSKSEYLTKIFFLICMASLLVGCFGDGESPFTDDTDEGDVDSDGHIDRFEGILEDDIPVVRMIEDDNPPFRVVGDKIAVYFYLEIDEPLDYPLFVYTQGERFRKDELTGKLHPPSEGRDLNIIEEGDLRSGLYVYSGMADFWVKVTAQILPAHHLSEISLPTDYTVGGSEENPFGSLKQIPEWYKFKPYRVGDPFKFVKEKDE